MTRFEVDSRFPDHRKVRRLGRDRVAGAGLWTLAGAWSVGHNGTGFVPTEIILEKRWDPKLRLSGLLVEVELWHVDDEAGEKGYRFHDWPDWRPGPGLGVDEDQADDEWLSPEDRKRVKARDRKREQRSRDTVAERGEYASESVTVTRDSHAHVTRDVTRDRRDATPLSSPPHPPISHPALPFGESARAAATRAPARDAHTREAPPSDLAQRCVREFTPRGVARRDLQKLALTVDEARADGASWPAIQQALVAWSKRSDCTTGLLPSLITQAVKDEAGATAGRPEHEQAPRETRGDATIRRLRGMKSGDSEPLRALTGGGPA